MPGDYRYPGGDLRTRLHWNRNRAEHPEFVQEMAQFSNNVALGPQFNSFHEQQQQQQCWSGDLGYRRDGGPMGPGNPPHGFNQHVRFSQNFDINHRISSHEEPIVGNFVNQNYHPGTMSVRVLNDDEFQLAPDFMNNNNNNCYTRRNRYGGVQPPGQPIMPMNQLGQPRFFDYNHQHQEQMGRSGPMRGPRPFGPLSVRPQKDPRINRLLNRGLQTVKCEPTSCEVDLNRANQTCAHPQQKVIVKREKDPIQTPLAAPVKTITTAAAAPSTSPGQLKPPSTSLLDRIEREKYEKAKQSRNLQRGERAVDSVRPVPRPAKNPELESELSIVIEKLNVPVITTPADFSTYKIPRASKTTEPATAAPSEPKEKESSPAPKIVVAVVSEVKQPVPKDNTQPKEKVVNRPVIKSVDKSADKPIEREASIKPKETSVVLSVKNKPVERVIRSSCDSPSGVSRRESSDNSDVDATKTKIRHKKKFVISSSESDSDGQPLKPRSLSRVVMVAEATKRVSRDDKQASDKPGDRSRDKRSPVSTKRRDSDSKMRHSDSSRKSSVDSPSSKSSSRSESRRSRSKTKDTGRRKSLRIESDSEDERDSKESEKEAEKTKNLPSTKQKSESNEGSVDARPKSVVHRSRSTAVVAIEKVTDESTDDGKESRKKKRRSKSSRGIDNLCGTSNSDDVARSDDVAACPIKPTVIDMPPEKIKSPVATPESHVSLISSSDDPTPNPKDLLERLMNTDPEILRKISLLLNNSTQPSTTEIPSTEVQIARRLQLPMCSIPLSVELPKAQSPTISSCDRDYDPAPSPRTPSVTTVTLTPYHAVTNVKRIERRSSMSPITSRSMARSVPYDSLPEPEEVERESPKLKRKKHKNELEKLQEDISRNFDLKFMMSERTVKMVKDVPKKISRRRQSMCSSLSTENGGLKMLITREPKAKPVMKRRLSVGSAIVPPPSPPVKDDIRNDDPFYDLDSGNCRLCTNSSDQMDAHYMQCHRDAEVFCCRIKYNNAIKLKRGGSCDVLVNADSSDYVCLLCEKKQPCRTYYDIYKHLASHTGEFYFKCTECDFRDVTFDAHHARLHQNKFEICPFPPWEDNKLVAFMCEMCHFVQLQKTNINKHIVCHHRDETTKPAFKEVVLLDFGKLTIANLDFEDLDGRFKQLPLIEATDKSWIRLRDVYQDYQTMEPASENEEQEEEVIGDVLERSFDLDVKKLMSVVVSESKPLNDPNIIRVDNITYDIAAQAFEFSNKLGKIRFTNYKKLKMYLQEINNADGIWSGFCYSCDEQTIYSVGLSAPMELFHLQNVHWHQTKIPRDIPNTVDAVVKPTNLLRPWLEKPISKSAADCQKMLKIPAILSTYKCMAADCHFFTNVMETMEKHLDQHDADMSSDDDTMIECCYCVSEFASPADYFTHVLDNHGTSQYYCPYCFYRSNYANAIQHVKVYHSQRNVFILDGKFDGVFSERQSDTSALMKSIQANVKYQECQGE